MAKRAIAFDGSLTTDLNKAVVDFCKLSFKISEWEVFDNVKEIGYDYLNLNSDDSIHSVIDKVNKALVSGKLVVTNINRKISGEIIVETEGDNLNIQI